MSPFHFYAASPSHGTQILEAPPLDSLGTQFYQLLYLLPCRVASSPPSVFIGETGPTVSGSSHTVSGPGSNLRVYTHSAHLASSSNPPAHTHTPHIHTIYPSTNTHTTHTYTYTYHIHTYIQHPHTQHTHIYAGNTQHTYMLNTHTHTHMYPITIFTFPQILPAASLPLHPLRSP